MTRITSCVLCSLLGLVALICGLLVPMHFRAVDRSVIEKAGQYTSRLVDRGVAMVEVSELGAARLLSDAAKTLGLPDWMQLDLAVATATKQHPEWLTLGSAAPHLREVFGLDAISPGAGSKPFTELILLPNNREKALARLQAAPQSAVQELLRCRALTNTVLFSASASASGQPFDAALAICGLLLVEGSLTSGLNDAVLAAAEEANRRHHPEPLEQILLDFLSLGQRFDWSQLKAFVSRIEDPDTLRLLTAHLRRADSQLPVLFAAVQLSGAPASVARYLGHFSETGLKDLGTSLRFGSGGVNELLRQNRHLSHSILRDQIARLPGFRKFFELSLEWCHWNPGFAFTAKWLLIFAGGFLPALALHFARPPASALERPLRVRGIHLARETLFALGFVIVTLLLTEPFLAQEAHKTEIPFRRLLPAAGGVTPAETTNAHPTFMNRLNLLTLLLFLVIQALIYIACLLKLAEIRRQKLPARTRLKLLENEDHLFDAGLYLGFVGTIIALILVSLGVIRPSLMAAYSSTSFGIIFVSIFKIFHLRPERRRLLLEAESSPVRVPPATEPAFATMP